MTINKKEFASLLSEKLKTTKKESEAYTDAMLEVITDCLAAGDTVRFIGFGEFGIKQTSERNGINPQTGEPIRIKSKIKPYFKAGKILKDSI